MTIMEESRMKKLSSCILIEWRKLIKSKLSIVTACSICLVPFIVGLFATMMKYPENFKNLGLISAKMEMMRITDWSSYLMTISQVISVGGLLIFGFTASWVFGREYSDKTMIDLLALPDKKRYNRIIQVYRYPSMELYSINFCSFIRIISWQSDWT